MRHDQCEALLLPRKLPSVGFSRIVAPVALIQAVMASEPEEVTVVHEDMVTGGRANITVREEQRDQPGWFKKWASCMFRTDYEGWLIPSVALGAVLLVTFPGAVLCTIRGQQLLAAGFTCIWTGLAAVIARVFSMHYHMMYERTVKNEADEALDVGYEDDPLNRPTRRFETIELHEYRLYNLMPRFLGTGLRKELTDQLHLRALQYASQYSDGDFNSERAAEQIGEKDEHGELRIQNVRKMINMIKRDTNANLPARVRWFRFLGFFFLVNYCINFVPVYLCVAFDTAVSNAAAWTIICGTLFFTVSLVNSASFDRDAAILTPPGSMFNLCAVLAFGGFGQALFTVALSYTDICMRIDEYWPSVLVFVIFLALTMGLTMRMLLGKLVDFCELRLELLAIGQGTREAPWVRETGEKFFDIPLGSIDKVFPLTPPAETLSKDAAMKLKVLSGELWERWGIGLGVLFLGLMPSFLKIVFAMWQGSAGEQPIDVLPEEIFTMMGTMVVLIILLLSDQDLWRWLNTEDLVVWVLLALFTLGAQISGGIFGLQAAWRSEKPSLLVFILVPALLAITVQLSTSVWASLVLDLKLIKLMYRGHTYLSRRTLPKEEKVLYKHPPDGMFRYQLPKGDYEDDEDEEDD